MSFKSDLKKVQRRYLRFSKFPHRPYINVLTSHRLKSLVKVARKFYDRYYNTGVKMYLSYDIPDKQYHYNIRVNITKGPNVSITLYDGDKWFLYDIILDEPRKMLIMNGYTNKLGGCFSVIDSWIKEYSSNSKE